MQIGNKLQNILIKTQFGQLTQLGLYG